MTVQIFINTLENKDSYWSIAGATQGEFSMMRSKFLSFAYPVSSEEEALEWVALTRSEYYDARHVCWAYRLGIDGERNRSNDDGEPSGTAGKPIMGQLVSAELTNIIVLVVRYFGGVKLGTSGLIEAYRAATIDVLERAERLEHVEQSSIEIYFGYDLMGMVMRLVKDADAKVCLQDFREHCRLVVSLRRANVSEFSSRLTKIYGVEVKLLEVGSGDELIQTE